MQVRAIGIDRIDDGVVEGRLVTPEDDPSAGGWGGGCAPTARGDRNGDRHRHGDGSE